MIVINQRGEEFELTPNEEKYLKAIEKLGRMKSGRLKLFANGKLDIRFNGLSNYRIIYSTSINCEGGDGGDDFD